MTAWGVSGTTEGDPVVPIFLGNWRRRSRGRLGHARSFYDFARSNTLRANPNSAGNASHDGPHALEIRIPTAVGLVVGVAHIVPEDRSLTTDITHSGHEWTPMTALEISNSENLQVYHTDGWLSSLLLGESGCVEARR